MWFMLTILECLREERPQYVDLAANTCFSFHPVVFIQSNYSDYKLHSIRKLMEFTRCLSQGKSEFPLTLLRSKTWHFLIGAIKMRCYQTVPSKIDLNYYFKGQVGRNILSTHCSSAKFPYVLWNRCSSPSLLQPGDEYLFSPPFPHQVFSFLCCAKNFSSGPKYANSTQRSKHPSSH